MNQEVRETTTTGDAATPTGGSRRDFLRTAGVAAAGAIAGGLMADKEAHAEPAPEPRSNVMTVSGVPVPRADGKKLIGGTFPKGPVMATGRVIGANDRIIVGFVGVGGMGGGHVGHFIREAADRNTQIGGICDVYQPSREYNAAVVKEKGVASASFVADKDYRKLLENKDIDAIVIATPEHWHCQIACHAMEAGKHVYIQKPMARYLDEAFQTYDIAKRTKRVVQVGSQGCSNMIYHAAGKAVRDGKIGPLVMGQGSYTRNNPKGEWNYGIPGELNKDTLDWALWQGSSGPHAWVDSPGGAGDGDQIMRRDPAALKSRYRKYWDYSAGILGDLMPHKLHPFLIASGNPEFPTRVSCVGTRIQEDRDVDTTVQVIAEFPSRWTMLFVGSTVNEQGLQDMFRGQKGTIYFGNGVKINPERPFAEEVEEQTIMVDGATYESHEEHEKNWLAAIRANDPSKANCNIDLAVKVQTIISLAEMSARWNKTMVFDEKTRKVTSG
ncbi:MAG: Gfo/Idh/MocA family oxidoreductase [Capsulimonadales bacterium]|nr:Gfo/Idh/MocA family oxidoreductase [Capsulimonadales bacterium]